MGISGQTIWRQAGNFLLKQKIIRKITYYEPGLSLYETSSLQKSNAELEDIGAPATP